MSTSTPFYNPLLTALRTHGMSSRYSGQVHRVYELIHGNLPPPEFDRDGVIDALQRASGAQVANARKITFAATSADDENIAFLCRMAMNIGSTLWDERALAIATESTGTLSIETQAALLPEIDTHITLPWRSKLQEMFPYLQERKGSARARLHLLEGGKLAGHPLACAVRHMQTAVLFYACCALRGDEPGMARLERLISLMVQRPIIGRDLTNPNVVLLLA